MRLVLSLLCILNFSLPSTYAQTIAEPGSAKAAALGGIGSTLTGADALFGNVAGIMLDSISSVSASYKTLFKLTELTTIQAGGLLQFNNSGLALSVSRYGLGAYHQHNLSLSAAHQLHKVSLGIKANIVQIATEGLTTRRAFVLSAGGISEIVPGFRIGAYAYNLNASIIDKETQDKLPTFLQIGLNWQAVSQLNLYAELEKELDNNTRTKLGLEYSIKPYIICRTGFSTQPANSHFGLGFLLKKLRLDYGGELNRYLGLRHQLTTHIMLRQ